MAGGVRAVAGLGLAGLGLAAAVGLPGAAGAPAVRDVYTVGGIPVDESGADGRAARAAALRAGERAAFRRLLQWMLLEGDADRVPGAVQADPSSLVTGYSVRNERRSAERYRAAVEVQFDPEQVRGLLAGLGLVFEERRPPPHVLIPLWIRNGVPVLWDDNPWLDAWTHRPPDGDFIPWLMPHGELGDVAVLSASAAAAGRADSLAGLARRYGVDRAVVARADPSPEGDRLTVSVQLTDRGRPLGEPLRLRLHAAVDEAPEGLLRRAAGTAARAAGDLWIRWRRDRRRIDGTLAARAEFGSFGEWRRVRTELRRSSAVAHVAVRRLTPRFAELRLAYRGAPEAMQASLTAAGLEVAVAGESWRLRFPPAAAARPGPEAAAPLEAPPPSVVD